MVSNHGDHEYYTKKTTETIFQVEGMGLVLVLVLVLSVGLPEEQSFFVEVGTVEVDKKAIGYA